MKNSPGINQKITTNLAGTLPAIYGHLSTSWVDVECFGKTGTALDDTQLSWLWAILKALWVDM
jgi:hypothetical protein